MSGKSQWLPYVAVSLFLLAGCGSPSAGAGLPPGSSAVFKATACPFSLKGGHFKPADIRCGYVRVPENRAIKHSPTIELAVAVFKAPGTHPAADPLIYLIGGPGGYVVQPMGSQIAQDGMPDYVGNRDLILVDQRGTGLSQPALTCPELYVARDTALTQHLSDAQTWTLLHAALRACRSRLVKDGIDLDAYNTAESASDIAAVPAALGYTKYDVFGGSYGSALALQLMRDHPKGIRSVVMDAVVVPPFKGLDEIPNFWHALRVLFKNCAADSGVCSILYPHLEQALIKLAGRLQSHPPTVKVYFGDVNRTYDVRLDTIEFLKTLRWALMEPSYISMVPKLITDASRGDYRTATQLENVFGPSNDVFTPDEGMALSMTCSSNVAHFSTAQAAAAARVFPVSLRVAAATPIDEALPACRIWNVPSVPNVNHAYFRTTIPSLLLPGAYDPNNSPAVETALAGHLTHSQVVFFPTLGHDVVGAAPCQDYIVQSFLASPNRRPDTACIADMWVPWE